MLAYCETSLIGIEIGVKKIRRRGGKRPRTGRVITEHYSRVTGEISNTRPKYGVVEAALGVAKRCRLVAIYVVFVRISFVLL